MFKKKKPVDILINSEEGFIDLTFDIKKTIPHGAYRLIKSHGIYKGQKLNINFNILNSVDGYDVDITSLSSYNNGCIIARENNSSDTLLNILANLYGIECGKLKMKSSISTACIPLQPSPIDIYSQKVLLKCFFNDSANSDDEYAECYINIDLPNGIVEFKEKDPEYRKAIISSLSDKI